MNPKIQQIADLLPQLEEKINEIDLELSSNPQSGFLDGRELKEALRVVVSDVKRLTRSNHLILYFTPREIDQLHSSLSQLVGFIPNQIPQIAAPLNILRPLVRSYWIRNRSQAETEQIQSCEEAVADLQEIISKKDQISSQAEELQNQVSDTREKLDELKKEIVQFEAVKAKANKDVAEIVTHKSKAESETATVEAKRATIDAFTEKIASREKDLEDLKANTAAHAETLEELEELNDKRQAELSAMIDDAKRALNLNTAIGLSSEFQAKAESLQPRFGFTFSDKKLFWGIPKIKITNFIGYWLVGSGVFVVLALLLALALMAGEVKFSGETLLTFQNDAWHQVLGRLSIVGLLVTAAIFCAKQYTKNGRLLEEYAYKKVVSASLPSILQELKGREHTTDSLESKYLIQAIEELHQHPLAFLDKSSRKGANQSDFKMEEFSKVQNESLSFLKKLNDARNPD